VGFEVSYRTHTCGELNKTNVDQQVTLAGWVNRRRDHGGLIFLDIRDRYGLTQVICDPEHSPEVHRIASGLRSEYVVQVTGTVVPRLPGTENPHLSTGAIEVAADRIVILNTSRTTPFPISDNISVDESLRLKYRYVDLRRSHMQRNIALRQALGYDGGPAEFAKFHTFPRQGASMPVKVSMKVNGKAVSAELEARTLLVTYIRDELHLTGTHVGCDTAQCGACTVLIDGRRVNSCLALAVSHDGAEILTIEGVARGDTLHPVQAAFIDHDGLQCGFCTPGQIMSAIGLIREAQAGDDPERVREAMSGNLCRCGAYVGITEAVLDAQARLREHGEAA